MVTGFELAGAGAWALKKAQEKAGEMLFDEAKGYFAKFVVGKWSDYRANGFLKALLAELQRESDDRVQSATLNDLLNKLGKGDAETSLLFDSYRRVALCASKEIGPMIIGILTGQILNRGAVASEGDEQIFMAAEALNDRDFSDFVTWFTESDKLFNKPTHQTLKPPTIPGAPIVAQVFPKATRGQFTKGDMPMNLFTDVGTFATKLSNLGLLMPFTRSANSSKNPEQIKHYIAATVETVRLNTYAMRALDAKSAGQAS